MKLEVGMYVRTKKGIFQITNDKIFIENGRKYIGVNGRYTGIGIDIIEKVSNNIIDLIEVGDYINGCYVSNKRASVNEHLGGHPKGIGIIKCNAYFNQGNYDDCKFEWIEEKDIKSIVTKEQFESIKYSLEG